MNEIRIDKSFNPQSHAAEANLYPRGVAEIRQRVASGGSFGSAAAGVKQLIGGAADLLGVITQAREESRQAADQVELTKLNNFAREQVLRLDGVTNERMLEEKAQGFRETFAQMISDNQNLSDDGRKQANIMLEKSVGAYRLEGVAQINRYWKNQQQMQAADSLNQAVAAGDLPGALNWFDRSLELGVTPKASRETVESMTFRNNLVNGYLSKLGIGALREEQKKLDEINPDGSFKEFPMIKAPQAAELQGWIRNRINIMTNAGQDTLDEMTAKGTLTPESLRELHEQGEISPAQWRAGLARIEKNRQATEQIISAARKERIQQTSNRISREMFEAYDQLGTASPQRLAAFKARFNEAITKAEAEGKLDDSQITALKKTLKGYCDDLGRADGGIKSLYIYQYARAKIDELEPDAFYATKNDRGGKPEPWFGTNKDKTEAIVNANFEAFKQQVDSFIRSNPQATYRDVDTFMDDLKEKINKTEVRNLTRIFGQFDTAGITGNARSKANELDAGQGKKVVEARKEATGGIMVMYDNGSIDYDK
ncbi:hypothetical protein [Victivallis vadensis]|jgi:hypothetical protein|uniref:hypothetical protein n=1 Tax=Victivallis vadensis TaxID=172901 RepID=UPI0020669A4B|nr:MAG TPA: hypothetical protein [Caudoviricetes sp.]